MSRDAFLPGLVDDPFAEGGPDAAGRRFKARVTQVLLADSDGFVTRPAERLAARLDGIAGDRHDGATRRAGSREPWYPRGTVIRNARQVTLVAPDELAEVARRMGIDEVRPEWIGANAVVEGVSRLSRLPAGTRLHFPDGAALAVEGPNGPCRHAGAQIAAHHPAREGLDLLFPKVARGLRGLIAWIERPGTLEAGEITVQVPEQRIWRG